MYGIKLTKQNKTKAEAKTKKKKKARTKAKNKIKQNTRCIIVHLRHCTTTQWC